MAVTPAIPMLMSAMPAWQLKSYMVINVTIIAPLLLSLHPICHVPTALPVANLALMQLPVMPVFPPKFFKEITPAKLLAMMGSPM